MSNQTFEGNRADAARYLLVATDQYLKDISRPTGKDAAFKRLEFSALASYKLLFKYHSVRSSSGRVAWMPDGKQDDVGNIVAAQKKNGDPIPPMANSANGTGTPTDNPDGASITDTKFYPAATVNSEDGYESTRHSKYIARIPLDSENPSSQVIYVQLRWVFTKQGHVIRIGQQVTPPGMDGQFEEIDAEFVSRGKYTHVIRVLKGDEFLISTRSNLSP